MSDQVTTTTYVAFLHPGVILTEETTSIVDARNPQQTARVAPNSAFAFFYFDIVSAVVELDGERIVTTGSRRRISKTYFVDAEVLGYDAVSALPGNNDILLSNMRSNRWNHVVRCRTGNFQEWDPSSQELVSS